MPTVCAFGAWGLPGICPGPTNRRVVALLQRGAEAPAQRSALGHRITLLAGEYLRLRRVLWLCTGARARQPKPTPRQLGLHEFLSA